MQVGFKVRRVAQPSRLVRQLMRNILELLQNAQRPMSDMEIISALATHHRRSDPDFQRQVRLGLKDAVSYGILKRQLDVYSLRSKRLAQIIGSLASGS